MFSPLRARAPASVERAALFVSVGLLTAGAWIALVLEGPDSFLYAHHHATFQGEGPAFVVFFLASWTAMTVAMMLPTTLPVLATLQTFAWARTDRWLLLGLTIAGYLSIWIGFGTLAYCGQTLWILTSTRLGIAHTPRSGPILLLIAGAFQFSSLKYKCLEKCRSSFSFVVEHWQGRREWRQAFRLGVRHGLYCVGCCWALMLLMFAFSSASLVWMLILAVFMATEKNTSWGRHLRVPVGVALLAWAVILALQGSTFVPS